VHEMGITQEILLAVARAADDAGALRVTAVRLTVGELTEVVPDALEFAWEALTPGTVAEGASLEISRTPGRSRCTQCGIEFEHDRFDRLCTGCGAFLVEVLSGSELLIDAVEVDLPDDVSDGDGTPAGTGGTGG
jgi:hydrogenase nickel incorporation protein HypA/HybF